MSDPELPPFSRQCMCVVCAREKGGILKRLVPIILRARPVRWVSLRPCTEPASSQRWLALEVQAPLNPVLVACHRFKRTQSDPVHQLVSEDALIELNWTERFNDVLAARIAEYEIAQREQ